MFVRCGDGVVIEASVIVPQSDYQSLDLKIPMTCTIKYRLNEPITTDSLWSLSLDSQHHPAIYWAK